MDARSDVESSSVRCERSVVDGGSVTDGGSVEHEVYKQGENG